MAKSMKRCIETGDFEEAVYRYNNTRANWKNSWWNTIMEIYNNFQEWREKYIIDPIKRTVEKIKVKAKAIWDGNFDIIYDCTVADVHSCGAYVIEHYQDDKRIWLKIGETLDLENRLTQHLKRDYKKWCINKVVVKAFYPCSDEDVALSVENLLRSYFKKDPDNDFLKKDRFLAAEWNNEVKSIIDEKYVKMIELMT